MLAHVGNRTRDSCIVSVRSSHSGTGTPHIYICILLLSNPSRQFTRRYIANGVREEEERQKNMEKKKLRESGGFKLNLFLAKKREEVTRMETDGR